MKRLMVAVMLILLMACPAYSGEMDWLRVIDKSYHMGKTYFYDEIQINSGQAIDEFSTDTTMAGESNTALPTERAVKHYSDSQDTSDKAYEYLVYDADAWPDLPNSWMITWESEFYITGSTSPYAIDELIVGIDDATDSAKGILSISDTGNFTLSSGDMVANLANGSTYTNFGSVDDDTFDELYAAIDDSWPSGGTPDGSDGYIQFATSGAFDSDPALFWDDVNKNLGIGTVTPNTDLEVVVVAEHSVIRSFSYSNTNDDRGYLQAGRADGTEDTPLAIDAADYLGELVFVGYDGS